MVPARGGRGVLLCLLTFLLMGPSTRGATLPEDLGNKTMLEQLLARKAFLVEHMKSDEWKRHVQQQLDARSGPVNQQGVLIVAGGRDMFANAAISLTVLRNHIRSSIPVEIVHFGPSELPAPELLAYINSFNGSAQANSTVDAQSSSSSNSSSVQGVLGPVFVTDALEAAPPEKAAPFHRKLPDGIKSFPAKVYALTHVTRFRKVLLLDADSMPLVEPELLFKVPLFQRTGSMFWPDLWYNAWVNDTIYTLVGDMKEAPWVNNKHHRLVDSGQMLFDRALHAEVLEYLWLLNSHHEWVYKHMHGDKDTFLLAFSMAGRREMFTQVPCFTRDAMRDINGHKHRFHHLGMVQSIPPATLGAALRAHQPQPSSTAAASGASSNEPGRQLAGSSNGDAGSSSWANAIADSMGISSSKSSHVRALAQATVPQPAAAGAQQAAGVDAGAGVGIAVGPSGGTAADAASSEQSEMLRLLSLPVGHKTQPSSSSHGGQHWHYQHPGMQHPQQQQQQVNVVANEAGSRQHITEAAVPLGSGSVTVPTAAIAATAAAAASAALRLLSLPLSHQSQPSSSSRGAGQWQYRSHSHMESGERPHEYPTAWHTLDSSSPSSSRSSRRLRLLHATKEDPASDSLTLSSSRRLRLLHAGKEEGPASKSAPLSSSSSSWRRKLLQSGDGDDDNPAHTQGDTGMEADTDGDVDSSGGAPAGAGAGVSAAEGDGQLGDDLGRPVVAAAAAAGSWGTLPGTGAAADPSAELLVGPKGPPRRPELRHVGVPVFFHRTSFNSKFFPDCLNADKIKTGYCEVEWVSVPLSSHQAGHSLKPNMFAWDDKHINTTFYTQHCGRNASHRSGSVQHSRAAGTAGTNDSSSTNSTTKLRLLQQEAAAGVSAAGGRQGSLTAATTTTPSSSMQRHLQQATAAGAAKGGQRRRRPLVERYGLPPEHLCDKLPIGEDVMPIPVMPISMFPYMQKVLQASYEAFAVVREKAGVKL